MGKSTISMAIFDSYFDITRGYLLFLHHPTHHCLNVVPARRHLALTPVGLEASLPKFLWRSCAAQWIGFLKNIYRWMVTPCFSPSNIMSIWIFHGLHHPVWALHGFTMLYHVCFLYDSSLGAFIITKRQDVFSGRPHRPIRILWSPVLVASLCLHIARGFLIVPLEPVNFRHWSVTVVPCFVPLILWDWEHHDRDRACLVIPIPYAILCPKNK